MSFLDRMRPNITTRDANWHEQQDFNQAVLGPWKTWSTTATENPTGTAALVWTGSAVDPAIGNGTLTGAWRELGDLVFVHIYLLVGSTTTFGTGSWQFPLPFAAHALAPQAIPGVLHAAAAGTRSPISGVIGAGAALIGQVDYAGGTVTDAGPATAVGDQIIIEGFYRPA